VLHLLLCRGISLRLPAVVRLLERLVLVNSLVPVLAPPNHYRGGKG
jgi:hypothetical protein